MVDTIALKGEMMLATPVDIDPANTGVHIRVEGEDGTIVDAAIPDGAYDKQTKTGWKSKNVPPCESSCTMFVPTMSAGMRSGVNWIRENLR